MSWIINIETAVKTASICLAKDGELIGLKINHAQADHAGWLQPAIASLLNENKITLSEIDAFAVSAGPGSYTGLRVAMATAKGLCFALQKPLILVNTLEIMAAGAVAEPASLFCPMIDARRMEVFTAVFDQSLNIVIEPYNCILTEDSFTDLLSHDSIVFFGNGSEKLQKLLFHPNAIFKNIETTAQQMIELSYHSYLNNEFADLAYCEPFYGKEFYSPALRKLSDI